MRLKKKTHVEELEKSCFSVIFIKIKEIKKMIKNEKKRCKEEKIK